MRLCGHCYGRTAPCHQGRPLSVAWTPPWSPHVAVRQQRRRHLPFSCLCLHPLCRRCHSAPCPLQRVTVGRWCRDSAVSAPLMPCAARVWCLLVCVIVKLCSCCGFVSDWVWAALTRWTAGPRAKPMVPAGSHAAGPHADVELGTTDATELLPVEGSDAPLHPPLHQQREEFFQLFRAMARLGDTPVCCPGPIA